MQQKGFNAIQTADHKFRENSWKDKYQGDKTKNKWKVEMRGVGRINSGKGCLTV